METMEIQKVSIAVFNICFTLILYNIEGGDWEKITIYGFRVQIN